MRALEGKIAIITGGTSGIGERITELFVEQGAKVVVGARREAEGAALARRLGIDFIRTDVAIEAEVKAMIDLAASRFGQVDCFVNNAGFGSPIVSIAEVTVEDFDRVMAVNARGTFLGIKHVAPVMLARKSGSIINISSMGALRGGLSGHAYAAAKGAVHALTRAASAELGEKGIRVNSISPGGIVTGIFGKLAGLDGEKADRLADTVGDLFVDLQPLPRAGLTDDIAQGCLFLASDAGGFVNGHDLVIDGGHTAVTWGWTDSLAFRAEMMNKIKAAAAKL
jgi:NAD(P)-dependent dehydrogenase (short-subunit alcohol dehydrogenase family)